MVYEEYADLEGFDPKRMNDPQYVAMVKEARQIKDNELEVKRSQVLEKTKQEQAQARLQAQAPKPVLVDRNTNDFTMSDFQTQERYDSNSPLAKQESDTSGSKPISGIWMSKGQIKKYIAGKMIFKIKELGQNRYRTYRYQSLGNVEVERLKQMSEDLTNFYRLMIIEDQYTEELGVRRRALFRNGKYYTMIGELESDFRKEIALLTLGINYSEFDELEMLSDPDFTTKDIWGLGDIIDGLLDKAINGNSFFLTASAA
jgi:hypothetical protein